MRRMTFFRFSFLTLTLIPVFVLPAGCRSRSGGSSQTSAPKHSTPGADAPQAAASQDTRICASVQAVSGEYIPLFHTNVFIKTQDQQLADRIESRLVQYHKLFDRHHYYYEDDGQGTVKNLRILNEYAAAGSAAVQQPLTDCIRQSLQLMKLTDNTFNIFLAPVTALYAGKFSPFPVQNTDPDPDLIAQALRRVLTPEQAASCITVQDDTISFTLPAGGLTYDIDLGGIAKGYAARQIQKEFLNGTFMLSLGSSTIIASGKSYRIGVASSYYKTLALIQLDLPSGMSLSTSGTSNSYYILADDGTTIRSHILDPKTGYSHDYYWSVILIGDNAMVTDALSTALFNIQDEHDLRRILDAVRESYGCTLEACLVKDASRQDKTVSLLMTPGFEPYIRKDYKGIGIVSKALL